MVQIKLDKILGVIRERDTISGAFSLNDATDVSISSPSIDQVLQYNGSLWVNQTINELNADDIVVVDVQFVALTTDDGNLSDNITLIVVDNTGNLVVNGG